MYSLRGKKRAKSRVACPSTTDYVSLRSDAGSDIASFYKCSGSGNTWRVL